MRLFTFNSLAVALYDLVALVTADDVGRFANSMQHELGLPRNPENKLPPRLNAMTCAKFLEPWSAVEGEVDVFDEATKDCCHHAHQDRGDDSAFFKEDSWARRCQARRKERGVDEGVNTYRFMDCCTKRAMKGGGTSGLQGMPALYVYDSEGEYEKYDKRIN
jgi:hypothetical protein